ncbi:proline-rich receptor-like protein kinase PERK9 [Quercus robur]|uniref:proline-rich receptor-like protein kinase PERK9 n=1 Tax=Quercus robur TaxID=38942 RepID=UPI002161582B|nr:proline-rich receptor-like protein kinase PERK9 [Quercus robur]
MPLLVVLLSLIQFRLPNLPPESDVVPLPDTPSKTVASHTSPIVVPPDVSSVDPSIQANAQPNVPSTTLPIPQLIAQPASHTSPIVVPPDVSSINPSVQTNAQPGVPSTTLPIPQPVAQPHLAPSQGLRRSTRVSHTPSYLQSYYCSQVSASSTLSTPVLPKKVSSVVEPTSYT